MSRFIYNPRGTFFWSGEEKKGALDSPEAFLIYSGRGWAICLNTFFSIPEVQQMVNKEKWEDAFREWNSGELLKTKYSEKYSTEHTWANYNEWSGDVLACFLTLLGIDFLKDMEDSFAQQFLNKSCLKERKERK